MKVPVILSALLASALTVAVLAAPSSTSTTTDDAALLASVVDYDEGFAAAMIKRYDDFVYGNSTIARRDLVRRAPASKDVIPFCVGIAGNPVRTQIFRNKMKCTENGWSTLWIFTAHTVKDNHVARYPICAGFGSTPSRSFLLPGQTNCGVNGYDHDFAFFQSGKIDGAGAANPIAEKWPIYTASGPEHMLIYPRYNGLAHGWVTKADLHYRNGWRRARLEEYTTLQNNWDAHMRLHKGLTLATPNAAANRRALNAIYLHGGHVPSTLTVGRGQDSKTFRDDAERDRCGNLTPTTSLQYSRKVKNGRALVEVIIGGKPYAAISIPAQENVSGALVTYGLLESLRTGVPVAVESADGVRGAIALYISKTYVLIGGPEVYNYNV